MTERTYDGSLFDAPTRRTRASREQGVVKKRILLDVAYNNKEFYVGENNIFWALEASDNTATFTAKFNKHANEGFPVKKGLTLSGFWFDKIYITSAAQSGKWIEIYMWDSGEGSPVLENPSGSFDDVQIIVPSTWTINTDVTCNLGPAITGLGAPPANTKLIIISNLATNTETVRVGDGGVSATRGVPLAPGESLILQGSMSVSIYTVTGQPVIARNYLVE